MFGISPSARLRQSPYFASTLAEGVTSWQVLNALRGISTLDADVTETTEADSTETSEIDATDTAAGEADLTGTTETAL